jgi:hypothetical protein
MQSNFSGVQPPLKKTGSLAGTFAAGAISEKPYE